MKTEHLVKHSTISRDKLHNKRLAWCKAGHPEPYTLFVDGPSSEDGKYILRASHTSVFPPSNSQLQGQGLIDSEYLDQSTVDKIVNVEGDCPLSHMPFDLAIIEDQQSGFLLKKN
jgi:hypothetical protein